MLQPVPSTQKTFDLRIVFYLQLPIDMENYMQYHIMGSVSKIVMKSGCIPSKFDCQPYRKKRASTCLERPYIAKKQRMETIEECLAEAYVSPDQSPSLPTTVADENLGIYNFC